MKSYRITRGIGVAMALTAAAVYFLIAAGFIYKQTGSDFQTIRIIIGLAGGSFVLGASLLAFWYNRWAYAAGAVLQVIVLIGYFLAASGRTPHYEGWGITCKAAQVVLFGVLVHLATRRRGPATAPHTHRRTPAATA